MAILIRNGVLVDGTARDPITHGAVLAEGNRIVAAGPEAEVRAPAGATVLDADGGTIIPGMFNLHDHFYRKTVRVPPPGASFRDLAVRLNSQPPEYQVLHSANNVLTELRSGVTTIRDFGGAGLTSISLRRGIDEGLMPGPRILTSALPICITGGHGVPGGREADGVDEVRKAVREAVKAGADCIKLMGSGGLFRFPEESPEIVEYTPEEMLAGVSEAHKFHKRTAVHAYATEAMRIAIRVGIDSIEHGVFLDEETVDMMKKAGTALVPTVSGLLHVPFQHKKVGREDIYQAIMEQVLPSQNSGIRMAWEAGLRIGTGSDTGGEVVEEVELIQEAAGMSNLDAIRCATRVSAEIIGVEKVTGTLEPGKRADLVVVGGQPLDNLADLRKPRWVLRDGRVFDGAPMPLGVRLSLLAG